MSDGSATPGVHEHITSFQGCRAVYEKLTRTLQDGIVEGLRTLGVEADVRGRTKSVSSFAEKVMRKQYRDPLTQMTDLAGVRVITHTRADARKVCQYIKKTFFVDEANSRDALEQLRVGEFGYRAVHYVVQVPEGVPDAARFLKAEVQVRTIPEHCWAEIGHDRLYKSAFKVPDRWKREFAAIAAVLESVDESFARIAEGLAAYEASYGGLVSEQQIESELTILTLLLEMNPGDEKLAHQVARLMLSRANWNGVLKLLEGFPSPSARLLLCGGLALGQQARKQRQIDLQDQGIELLERAYQQDRAEAADGGQRNVEIVVTLAEALAQRGQPADKFRIGERYREAFALDPGHPRVLIGQFQYRSEQEDKDLPDVTFLTPLTERAVRRCQDQIEVRVNLPWAYYNLGELRLIERKPYECLNAYAKAVQCSASEHMLEAALESLSRFNKAGSLSGLLPLVRRLLHLGLAARFGRPLSDSLRRSSPENLRPPVVIVAGGCDRVVQDQILAYRPLFQEAFRDFEGTIISGGTSDGVCGLVAEVARAAPSRIQAVTYAPRKLPQTVELDETYQVREVGDEGFGPEQPLQNWTDLLAQGVRPSEVRLIGVNGGTLAAFEYRLALALGAMTGVIEESGRAVSTLVRDAEWQSLDHLIRLPPDGMTVWNYLRDPLRLPPALGAEQREQLAHLLHKRYLEQLRSELRGKNPNAAEWENLSEDARDSNRLQADHIIRHLDVLGIEVRPADQGPATVKLNEGLVEQLARMEHGRWNLEKLKKGWKHGATRDDELRLHPLLCGWDELKEEAREANRVMARLIPLHLKQIGLVLHLRSREQTAQ